MIWSKVRDHRENQVMEELCGRKKNTVHNETYQKILFYEKSASDSKLLAGNVYIYFNLYPLA